MKKNHLYIKKEDIEEKVKKLERRLEHTTLTEEERCQALSLLKTLEHSKVLVSQVKSNEMGCLSLTEDLREQAIQEVKICDVELSEIRATQAELKAHLDALRGAATAVPETAQLLVERQECYVIIKAAKAAKAQLYKAFKAEMDLHFDRERAVRRQGQAQRGRARSACLSPFNARPVLHAWLSSPSEVSADYSLLALVSCCAETNIGRASREVRESRGRVREAQSGSSLSPGRAPGLPREKCDP